MQERVGLQYVIFGREASPSDSLPFPTFPSLKPFLSVLLCRGLASISWRSSNPSPSGSGGLAPHLFLLWLCEGPAPAETSPSLSPVSKEPVRNAAGESSLPALPPPLAPPCLPPSSSPGPGLPSQTHVLCRNIPILTESTAKFGKEFQTSFEEGGANVRL